MIHLMIVNLPDKNAIGPEGFHLLMNDERFAHTPKILETPKSDDLHEDVENMNV